VQTQIELHNHLKLFKDGLSLHTPGFLIDSDCPVVNQTGSLGYK
jgi:hypothetical protein